MNKIKEIIEFYKNGGTKTDAVKYISKITGLKETQSRYWANYIFSEYIHNNEIEEQATSDISSNLEFSSRYVYNKDDDTYLFLLEKKYGKNVILSNSTVKSIISLYSNFDDEPHSINQISIRYSIPRPIVIEILKILGITHDSLPITQEDLKDKKIETLANECLENKKFALYQKIQKDSWSQTKIDARKWNEFIINKYNPFEDLLNNWTPKNYYKPSSNKKKVSKTHNQMLIVLTDTHIGELTEKSFTGKYYDSSIAALNIQSYFEQIKNHLETIKDPPSMCNLVLMGDILNSCVDGMTRKGTKLKNDIINNDLFEFGFDILVEFITNVSKLFNNTIIHTVCGNHDSILINSLYYAASRYFEKDINILWNISKHWLSSFKINNCYFIYTHGKDDETHVAIPKNVNKTLESYIQSLLLSKIDELVGVKSKYFVTGHLHSFVHKEMNDFEFLQMSSTVNADSFAESIGCRSKSRQNCFIVGEDNIKQTLHFYF